MKALRLLTLLLLLSSNSFGQNLSKADTIVIPETVITVNDSTVIKTPKNYVVLGKSKLDPSERNLIYSLVLLVIALITKLK